MQHINYLICVFVCWCVNLHGNTLTEHRTLTWWMTQEFFQSMKSQSSKIKWIKHLNVRVQSEKSSAERLHPAAVRKELVITAQWLNVTSSHSDQNRRENHLREKSSTETSWNPPTRRRGPRLQSRSSEPRGAFRFQTIKPASDGWWRQYVAGK